ncbi:MAG: hypothetical protein EPN61_04690 [Burkholderiaceae bacterium]|nr:MAG: hypothetical protein EPN61_04690 [Burkholderiaceae bacterium]
MSIGWAWRGLWAAASLLAMLPAEAIESQALGVVQAVPPRIHRVFPCGNWSQSGHGGYYRVVLADVSGGVGTEVYIQTMQETVTGANLTLSTLETTPVRELNDDHGQYLVSSAKCVSKGAKGIVELKATFEHDEGNVAHRIRVVLTAPGSYKISNTVVRSP